MRKPFRLLLFLCVALFFSGNVATAQTDTKNKPLGDTVLVRSNPSTVSADDDDFNAGLLVIGAALFCCMIGAAIVGSFVAAFAVLLTVIFISAGVLSASILAGFYRKSVSAGFKTFIVIICAIGGTAIGSVGLLVVTKLFKLHLSGETAFLTGAAGGLGGGILMGFVIYRILELLAGYINKRLQLV